MDVIDNSPSPQDTADQAITDNAQAEVIKNQIDAAQSAQIQATQIKDAVTDKVSSLKSNRDNVLDLFRASAVVLYPELGVVLASKKVLAAIPKNHPVMQIFQTKYQPELDKVDSQIAQSVQTFTQQTLNEQAAGSAVTKLVDQYQQLQSTAPTDLPTVNQFLNQNPQTMPFTPNEDASLFAQVIGMEFIDPEVQKFIFYSWDVCAGVIDPNQLQTESPPDLSQGVKVAAIPGSDGAVVSTPNAAPLAVSTLNPAISTAMLSQVVAPQPSQPKTNLWLAGAAVAAIFYLFK